ncbi:MAG TPA: hypothetical protein VFA49_09905, partial [Chloroflexota bacterium]|nr:hypothetical protein [Chloroflexota bacterium]
MAMRRCVGGMPRNSARCVPLRVQRVAPLVASTTTSLIVKRWSGSTTRCQARDCRWLTAVRVASFCADRRIPLAARGSATASLAGWSLGLVELCPVDHALDASTFVYPGRPDPPDLDLEVAVADEPAVRAFALATVPTGTDDEDLPNARPLRLGLSVSLGSRQAVRHVGAALGLEAPRVNGLARLVPLLSSPGAIEDVLTRAPEIGIADLSPNAEPYNTVLTVAARLEGLPQRYGPHPSGLAVAPEGGPSMLRWLPGQWVSSPRSSNFRGRHTPVTMQPQAQSEPSDGLAHLNGLGLGLEQPALVCQWDRDDLAALGIPKLDISPSVALATVNAEAAQPASPEAATAAWRMIEAGDTLCINQAETVGLRMLFKRATDALQALGADGRAIGSVEELAQLLALWRPGAYSQERAESYFAVKFGAEQPAYAHPSMAAVLDPTYGQVLYAEQIAELVELLGFDHAWAERFRRALATGRALERDAMERDLRKVASARQWTDAQTNALIALLVEHSGLLFKHGHALALAHRAYQQAQRKVDPASAAAWFAACLSAGGSQYGLGAAAEEARRFGVILLPPCVNRSGQAFVAELGAPELQAAQEKGHGVVGAVRVPLAAIRGLSQEAVGHILSVRAAYGPFMGLLDFLRKVDHRFVSRNDVLLL